MKKIIFYLVWIAIILVGPFTVYSNTPLASVLSDQALLINYFQRLIGLIAFSLIFSQVILGSFMGPLTRKLGAWIYKFHITEGIFTYLFILAHPLLFVFFNYKIRGTLDPFSAYTDICIICKPQTEYFYTFGRVAFWFLTIGVAAAKFRTHPWLRVHWKKLHVLNYFAFYLIALHSWFVGSDVRSTPFVWFFWLTIISVSGIVVYKISHPFFIRLKLFSPRETDIKLQK